MCTAVVSVHASCITHVTAAVGFCIGVEHFFVPAAGRYANPVIVPDNGREIRNTHHKSTVMIAADPAKDTAFPILPVNPLESIAVEIDFVQIAGDARAARNRGSTHRPGQVLRP